MTEGITLHFEKASDMLCSNVDCPDKPKIAKSTTEMRQEQLDDIPRGYKADFSITVANTIELNKSRD